jgi:hypothetical protein
MIPSLIFLALMLVSHFQFGEKKDGLIRRIHEGGFNGIAGIIWEEDQKMI